MPVSRRDLVRWSALGVGIGPVAVWLSACGGPSSSASTTRPASTTSRPTTSPSTTTISTTTTSTSTATTSVASTTSVAPSTVPFDPARPWWMQGGFAPVQVEVESTALAVRGAIPPELTGTYVRNGSNPSNGDSPHWFFGDGMVHGVRLESGRAVWYRNRYVQTAMYQAGASFGQGPPGGASNQSNVSCIWHAQRLLTSGEVGLPFELDVDDLSTAGPYDFAGALATAFTAHPKIDPHTGRMHSFGYGFTAPFLTYHVIEPDGSLVHTESIELPRSTMLHDFAITESDAVFWDLPVVFDLDAAIAYIQDPASGSFPYRWDPDAGARVGIMPLAGGADQIRWFEIDPCYAFHGVNAFRRGDEVVVDICRLSSMFAPGEVLGGESSLRRWTFDTASGSASDEVIETDDPGDLPSRDPRRVGREHRFGYLVGTRDNPDTVDFGGLIKQDFVSGRRERWEPGASRHTGEWLFVPTSADAADDAGYLLTYVYDDATTSSSLVIVDATSVTAGPVAEIDLPQRVPYGFHAAWVPDG